MVSVVEIRDEKSGLMGCIIQMAGMASGTIIHDGRERELLVESVGRQRFVVPEVRIRSARLVRRDIQEGRFTALVARHLQEKQRGIIRQEIFHRKLCVCVCVCGGCGGVCLCDETTGHVN